MPEDEATQGTRRPLAVRLLRGFGMFWWDFLVGDTPELFVATLVIVGVVAAIGAVSGTVAWLVLPALVVAALALSVLRGRRGS